MCIKQIHRLRQFFFLDFRYWLNLTLIVEYLHHWYVKVLFDKHYGSLVYFFVERACRQALQSLKESVVGKSNGVFTFVIFQSLLYAELGRSCKHNLFCKHLNTCVDRIIQPR